MSDDQPQRNGVVMNGSKWEIEQIESVPNGPGFIYILERNAEGMQRVRGVKLDRNSVSGELIWYSDGL